VEVKRHRGADQAEADALAEGLARRVQRAAKRHVSERQNQPDHDHRRISDEQPHRRPGDLSDVVDPHRNQKRDVDGIQQRPREVEPREVARALINRLQVATEVVENDEWHKKARQTQQVRLCIG